METLDDDHDDETELKLAPSAVSPGVERSARCWDPDSGLGPAIGRKAGGADVNRGICLRGGSRSMRSSDERWYDGPRNW